MKQRKRSDQTKVSDPNGEPWVWRSISFAVGEKVYRAISARLQDDTFILAKPLEIPPKTVLAVHKSRVTAYSKPGKLNPKLGGPTGGKDMLRFSKEIVVSNATESKYQRSLSRLISARLRAVRCKLVCTSVAQQRKRITSEIRRLQNMQAQLRQVPAATVGFDHPKVRAAMHRAIKTHRQAIKRKLDRKDQHLTVKERMALLNELRTFADTESGLFGVIHKTEKSFAEYGGRFPTADEIIRDAVIQRCLRSRKPHLIMPKLAAMFPETYAAELAKEIKRDPKVRRVVHRMNAGQIKGKYNDPIERLIAENYFESSKLPKPLSRLSRDEAVKQLEKHFQTRITVDKYRRHVKSLFLREYS